MALLDFFKKKKKPERKIEKKPKKIKKPVEKEGKIKLEPKEEKTKARPSEIKIEKQPEARPRVKKISAQAYKVLHSPHIAEKSTDLEKENKYVFKVLASANKIEIKKTVEDSYGVDVENVRIINIHRRQRRLGKQRGWKKGYKKAIVKVKKGQKIEILPR